MKKYVLFLFLFICSISFAQIYTLNNNEKIVNSYINQYTNYAIILEKNSSIYGKSFDILYQGKRLEGYKDSGVVRVLPNNTLVATMLKPSLVKDMWVVIYGNKEQEFDSIEKTIFSSNNSIIFTRYMNYGIAVINGESTVQYDTLFDAIINDSQYAFSYSRNGEYFVNINGEEKSVSGFVDRLRFSLDGRSLIYVINGEDSAIIYNGKEDTESFKVVEDLFAYNKDLLAYSVKPLPEITEVIEEGVEEELVDTNEITNTSIITNYDLSNISVLTNEEGVTVKGISNTIALVMVTNVITNIVSHNLDIPFDESSSNINITNEFVSSSIIVNNINYGNFDFITNISFSPNGRTLLFVSIDTNNTQRLFVGGNSTTNYDNILLYKYSDDSKNLAYAVLDNDEAFIVLNGRRLSDVYENINDLYFSKNNDLVYNISKNNREYLIAPNFESPHYNSINSFKFIDDNSFVFTAERLGKHYYFLLDANRGIRKELGGYSYISHFDDDNNSSLSLASDGRSVFIIDRGNILK